MRAFHLKLEHYLSCIRLLVVVVGGVVIINVVFVVAAVCNEKLWLTLLTLNCY